MTTNESEKGKTVTVPAGTVSNDEDKAAPKKKAVPKKKTTVKKKAVVKKTVPKKKAAVKKVAAKKKATAKKTTVTKKVTTKKKVSDGVVGRKEILKVDPSFIIVNEDNNPRFDYGDIAELKASIKENGVKVPIEVFRNKDSKLELNAGYRRMRAIGELLKEKIKIEAIPAILLRRGISDVEKMFDNLLTNEGKKFTPLEEAEAFRRLIDWGVSEEDIAKRMARSLGTVKNRLMLVDASPTLKKAVDKGTISVSVAKNIIKTSNGDVAAQNKMVKEVKETKETGTPEDRKRVRTKLGDSASQSANKGVSAKRARTLLKDATKLWIDFIRSGKPANQSNLKWQRLEKKMLELRRMNRKGLFS